MEKSSEGIAYPPWIVEAQKKKKEEEENNNDDGGNNNNFTRIYVKPMLMVLECKLYHIEKSYCQERNVPTTKLIKTRILL
jgi:hypothetical protein